VKRVAALFLAAVFCASGGELLPMNEPTFSRTLENPRGKIILYDFWATWCEPCRVELPQLVKLEQKWRARGLVLVTVSADEPEQEAEAFEFLKRAGAGQPAYIKRVANDDAFIGSVDAKWSGALPALFLYGRDGRLAASFIGETEISEIEKASEKLL
jgi:thiol-disulfide isomerase/thioredoxin